MTKSGMRPTELVLTINALRAKGSREMFGLYKQALSDSNGLTVLLTMVLLDDEVYRAQRKGLIDFAKTAPAKDAGDLSVMAHTALCNLAAKMWKETSLPAGASAFLWKARQGGIQPK
jgi:hypothetical protein